LAFDGAVDSHCASLNPETARHYRGTVRNFLLYLAKDHPDLTLLASLRRDPHILGWMSHLRAQQPPLVTASYINRLLAMRCVLTELAGMQQLPDLAHSIRSDDIPVCRNGSHDHWRQSKTSSYSRSLSAGMTGVVMLSY
jgi:hypothetical protein